MKKTALFEVFSQLEIDEIEDNSETMDVIGGDAIFLEGSKSDALYLIEQGSVKIVKSAKEDEQSLRELSEGAVFGEMGLLDGSPRAVSIVAKGNVKIKKIPYAMIEKLIAKSPVTGMKFYKNLALIMSNRIRTTTTDLADLKDLKLKHV